MMRNSWRLLLLRGNASRSSSSSSIINSSRFQSLLSQVDHPPPPPPQTSFSSFITPPPNAAQRNNNNNFFFFLAFDSDIRRRNVQNRFFTSESSDIIEKNKYMELDPLAQIFSNKSISSSEAAIREELDSLNISITHEMVLTSLKNLKENHESALRLFNWVSLNQNERLSSKSYNLILGNLGRKEYIKEFWNVVEVMRKKGYGLCKGAYLKVSENFEKEEMVSDLTRLKQWFTSEDPTTTTTTRGVVCKVIREHEWDEQVQKRLGELNISCWSSDVVEEVLQHLSVHPMKALMFFWWIEETPSFKHTHNTYNAMLKVLGREDCIDKFWRVVDEMKEAGFAMEKETYVTVIGRFYNRRMIKDAVDLYEFMMRGPNKPLYHDTSFLLRKILVDKDLDMDLFARVIGIFTQGGGGNSLTKSLFDGVLKSLASVSRLQECGKVLKAMEKGGFVADGAVQSEVIFQLGRAGKVDECYDILKELETSGSDPNSNRTWASMIQGQCEAGYVDAASTCFRKMVEKNGVANAGYPLELLMNAFCRKQRAGDAFKFLSEMVNAKQLEPWHSTYKMLIQKLLVRGNLKEALSLIGLMKNHGFPPFLDPFVNYISKSGTGDDAISFLEATSVKKCPSTSVFIRMFEAFFKAGRHNEAQDCLSKCPGYIRSHADVLNLFFQMKSEETVDAVAVVAA